MKISDLATKAGVGVEVDSTSGKVWCVACLAAAALDALLCQIAVQLAFFFRAAAARDFLVREAAQVKGVLLRAR